MGFPLVLDGQQRLRTLQAFYRGVLRDRAFSLQYVQSDFQGLTYDELDPDARRRLDNSVIHATIVRQEVRSEDQSGIYKSGSTPAGRCFNLRRSASHSSMAR